MGATVVDWEAAAMCCAGETTVTYWCRRRYQSAKFDKQLTPAEWADLLDDANTSWAAFDDDLNTATTVLGSDYTSDTMAARKALWYSAAALYC